METAERQRPAQRSNAPLEVLDFGTGPCGTSRVILQSILETRGRLALFDKQSVVIEPPLRPHVHIAPEYDVYGYPNPDFDLISLSYVLCCLGETDPALTLLTLREYHRTSLMTIVDYTMKNFPRNAVLRLLNTHAEQEWMRRDQDHFVEARTQFTPQSLRTFAEQCGYDVIVQQPLDPIGIRSALLLQPRD